MNAPSSGPPSDQGLDALWSHVLDNWEDDNAHTAFVQLAGETGQLAAAAARYRGISENRERRKIAERQLAAITVLAFNQIDASRSRPRNLNRLAVFVALGLVLLIGLFIIWVSSF